MRIGTRTPASAPGVRNHGVAGASRTRARTRSSASTGTGAGRPSGVSCGNAVGRPSAGDGEGGVAAEGVTDDRLTRRTDHSPPGTTSGRAVPVPLPHAMLGFL